MQRYRPRRSPTSSWSTIHTTPRLQNMSPLSPMQACHAVKVAAVHDCRILDIAPHHRHVACPPGRVNRMRRVPLAHCRERCTERTIVGQATGTLGASANVEAYAANHSSRWRDEVRLESRSRVLELRASSFGLRASSFERSLEPPRFMLRFVRKAAGLLTLVF